MLQKNKYSISEIAELTQLSEEDVKKIAQELKSLDSEWISKKS